MRIAIAIAASMLAAASYAADQVDASLSRILTKDQYEVLDVGAMTSIQKTALIEALRAAYAAGQTQAVSNSPPARVATPSAEPTDNVVESQIDGTFNGWSGDTIVKLTNGQIWQQSEYHYEYHYAYRPEVLIYSSGGGYKIKVEDMDEPVGVRRLK